jgi:hypothetical protein
VRCWVRARAREVLMHGCGTGRLDVRKYEDVHEQISALQTLMRRIDALRLDSVEYAYLKITAFTTTGTPPHVRRR